MPEELESPADRAETLIVAATAGRYASQVIGRRVPMDGSDHRRRSAARLPMITYSFGSDRRVHRCGRTLSHRHASDRRRSVLGVIAVARRPHQPAFDDAYLELVSDFARHAAIALALAAGRDHALDQELAEQTRSMTRCTPPPRNYADSGGPAKCWPSRSQAIVPANNAQWCSVEDRRRGLTCLRIAPNTQPHARCATCSPPTPRSPEPRNRDATPRRCARRVDRPG